MHSQFSEPNTEKSAYCNTIGLNAMVVVRFCFGALWWLRWWWHSWSDRS